MEIISKPFLDFVRTIMVTTPQCQAVPPTLTSLISSTVTALLWRRPKFKTTKSWPKSVSISSCKESCKGSNSYKCGN